MGSFYICKDISELVGKNDDDITYQIAVQLFLIHQQDLAMHARAINPGLALHYLSASDPFEITHCEKLHH